MTTEYPHYMKSVVHFKIVDIYRILQLYEVTDPCIAHAIKKLLCAGQRGAKSEKEDIIEAIDTLKRWVDMQDEDKSAEIQAMLAELDFGPDDA